MRKVLHLSHTDIASDSRIIKSLQAAKDSGYLVQGIGMRTNDVGKDVDEEIQNKLGIISLNIFWRKFRGLPSFIRHPLVLIEFYLKIFFLTIKNKPDLIHCNDTLPLPIAVFASIFIKTKIIYDAHELESEKNGLSNLMKKVIFRIEKLSWNRVAGLIVVSPSIKSWYEDKFKAIPTEIVMNAPELSQFKREKNLKYFHEKYDIESESLVFLYIGGFMPGRGLDLVAKIIGEKQGCHIVYMGYGSEKEKLIDLSKKHKNIHVHEPVEHHKVVSLAQSADIGLCLIEKISLSDYYCLPNKLFEYAFSSLPVLATNFPDIRTVVDEYNLGVCVDLNTESIEKGIDNLLSNYDSFKGGYETVNLEKLSWEYQAKNIVSLYSSVLGEQ